MDTTVGGSGTPSKKRRTALIVGIVVVIVVIAAVAVTLAYLPHKTIPTISAVLLFLGGVPLPPTVVSIHDYEVPYLKCLPNQTC